MARRIFKLLSVVAVLFAGFSSIAAPSAAPQLSPDLRPSEALKLRVSDPAVARALIGGGGRALADYGSFQIIAATPALGHQFAGRQKVEDVTRHNRIELHSGVLDTTSLAAQAMRSAEIGPGRHLHLIQFVGPPKPEWASELEAAGAMIVTYIPNNSYLVYGDREALGRLQQSAAGRNYVQWEGRYLDQFKIHPRARANTEKTPATDWFAVQMVADADSNPATFRVLDQLKLEPIRKTARVLKYVNVIVRLPTERLTGVAAQPDVVSIQPYLERRKLDERQGVILSGNLSGNGPAAPGYLAWLASKGFSQSAFSVSGFAVDITDSGIDNGSTAPGHFALYPSGATNQTSRVIYNRLEGTANPDSTIQACDGHGNLNAHIVAGYDNHAAGLPHTDAAGFRFGLGICPFVRVGSSVIFDPDKFTSPDYTDLQSRAYHDGARVSNNSWGAPVDGMYDVDAQEYDALVRDAEPAGSPFPASGNQEMVLVFAAGNEGPGPETLSSPGSAKNVITVGAAESVRSASTANGGADVLGTDGCGTRDVGADNLNDLIGFTSRGPCEDGRLKPDLVAPGTHITGGAPQSNPPPPDSGPGSALQCFTASGVCALPGGGAQGSAYNFFPLGQQFYAISSGTSHSCPAVAGCCALLRQLFINQSSNPPSPALTKAFLVNSARYLTGLYANDSLWSPNQGMGEVNLGVVLDGTARVLHDQVEAERFTASGQVRTIIGTVQDSSKPFRVTLAWTDAPGSTSAAAYNNDLDLTVTIGGNTYKGNVFNGQFSTPGGTADPRNNVESVFLPAGLSGNFEVTITAANINSDGVPNVAPATDQDFALVIYNAAETVGPVVTAEQATVSAESCNPANNAVDPGESVTVNLALRNIGGSIINNLVATLQSNSGVTNPGPAQNYGTLMPGGGSVSRPFTFTAVGSCGASIDCTLALQDAASLGAVTFTIPLGQVITLETQNFDSVSAPALPNNWSSSASGYQSPWITSPDASNSPSNSAFASAAAGPGISELVTPIFTVVGNAAQLNFRHFYNLESGQDGGVLEMKIGSGSFVDVISAGGTFVIGGYTHTLSGSTGNPLGGRQGWSGNSGGFIVSTLKLPHAAIGQNVQFRWRCATDSNNSSAGWYIDDIMLTGRTCCGIDISVPPLIEPGAATLLAESCAPGNQNPDPGETVTFNLALQNVGAGNASNLVATLLSTNGVSSPSGPQSYGGLTSGSGAVNRPFTFTASGTCGATIHPTLHLEDGTNDLGLAQFELSLGQFTTVFSENGDGITPPALPPNWSSSASDFQSEWTSTGSASDTFPNSFYSPDPSGAGLNQLVTPTIIVPASPVQLSFRHRFDLETSPSGTVGYDGGVLEIKIGSGAFSDIIDAGGTFQEGEYSHVLSSQFGNPLAGRPCWSGNSGGFITTTVLLPPAAQGQQIQLRWRCASDGSTGGGGWYVDTVLLSQRACCGEVTPPVASFSANPLSGGKPLTVTLTDASSGTITNRFWNFGNGATTNTTATSVAITYATVGTNTVSLTVSGPLGMNQLSRTNYVIVTNAVPMVVANGFALGFEGCSNGVIDPGEAITLNLNLRNAGTAPTTNVVATLLATGGVSGPSGPQTYGALQPGGATVGRAFTFTATGSCGATNTATLQLQDGPTSLGTATFKFALGQFGPIFTQSFDVVSPPALPAGWSNSSSGAGAAWTTSIAQSESFPNSVFCPSVNTYGVSDLVSPPLLLPSGATQLAFQQLYSLENGYDGGILEIKIGAGPFTNIVYAGGSFVTNGYNITLPTFTGNPLGGQPAWSGTSGPFFIPCVVNLPASASGQTVQFRWRCGSDESTADTGWYIDSVSVSAFGCCSNAPWIAASPQSQAVWPGGSASLGVLAGGSAPLAYQWRLYGTNLPGATASALLLTNIQSWRLGPYYALVINPLGWATSLTANVSFVMPPNLDVPQLTGGVFSFWLSGNSGVNYVVERSTNLVDWSTFTTGSNTTGQILISDPAASNFVRRFYRVRLVP